MKPGFSPSLLLALSLMGSTTLMSGTALAQAHNEQMGVETQSSKARTQVLNLPIGRSAMVDLPVEASDVFVSNPKVADAVLRTPRRIFVLGTGPGTSDALFFDRMGRQILALSIHVEAATDQIDDVIKRLFPGTRVELQALNDRIVLSGQAESIGEADQIARLAASYVTKPENVINLMSIAGKDQVAIKVRVVEVNRTAIKQLGFDMSSIFEAGNGTVTFGQVATWGVNQQVKGAGSLQFNASPGGRVQSFSNNLKAFERAGLVRTLAEPNLTAVSGEAAKFLAGGEFPVPTGRDSQGNITIQFKPYGVGLGFTPVVLSDGRISLKVSSEVSELSNEAAIVIGSSSTNSNGTTTNGATLTIPSLSVRRAESTVEMASGESLMLAGLLQSKYKQTIDSLPGLTTLPILGTLFRSRDFLNDQTELVVILTAYIVSPTSPDNMQTPADGLKIASDLETVFLGRLNKVSNHKPSKASSADGDKSLPPTAPYAASVGYVIE